MLFGARPNLRDLPEWGSRVFVMTQLAGKLDAKSEEARWVGYSGTSQGHRIYRPNTQRISVERNVTFGGEVLLPPVMLDAAPIVGEQDTVKETNQSHEGTAQPVEDLQKPTQPANDRSKRAIPASVIQSLEWREPRCSE